MTSSVNLSSVSSVSYKNEPVTRANVQDSQVKEAALPVISSLGDQASVHADRAYAACYIGCTAALAAATLTPLGIILCFEGCLPLVVMPPLSC